MVRATALMLLLLTTIFAPGAYASGNRFLSGPPSGNRFVGRPGVVRGSMPVSVRVGGGGGRRIDLVGRWIRRVDRDWNRRVGAARGGFRLDRGVRRR